MLSSITAHQKGRCWFALRDVKEQREWWRRRRQRSGTISRFQVWESSTSQYEKIKVSENVLYFTGHNHEWMREKKKITRSICEGWQVFKLHWRHFLKSAEEGGRHGAVQCKAATGFVPVHCCRSPHIRLIQSQRHQMPWECQTRSLKRQPAQRKKHKQHSNNRGYTLWKNQLLCRNANGVVKMEKMGRMKKKKRFSSWVNCMKTACADFSVFTISNIRLCDSSRFLLTEDSDQLYRTVEMCLHAIQIPTQFFHLNQCTP